MYIPSEIQDILNNIKSAKLSAPAEMFEASAEELCKICNGVGGESMDPKLRGLITKVYNFAECSAAIHDWAYHHSDGTPEKQAEADERFLSNGLRELKYRYKWYNWRRWWGERKLVLAYRALEWKGEGDWCIAFRNNVLQLNK